MNRCPITYTPCGENRYSDAGLRLLSPELNTLKDLEYTAEEQRKEAYYRASKMSIQGVQPKLSVRLNIREGKFEVVDKGGKYILKPQDIGVTLCFSTTNSFIWGCDAKGAKRDRAAACVENQ